MESGESVCPSDWDSVVETLGSRVYVVSFDHNPLRIAHLADDEVRYGHAKTLDRDGELTLSTLRTSECRERPDSRQIA